MMKWDKERKELERLIKAEGVAAAYSRIPRKMLVGEWPKELVEYHEEALREEAIPLEAPSPAEEARKARINELRRGIGSDMEKAQKASPAASLLLMGHILGSDKIFEAPSWAHKRMRRLGLNPFKHEDWFEFKNYCE